MKRFFALLICLGLLLTACGGKKPQASASIPQDNEAVLSAIYGAHTEIDLPLMTNPLDLSDLDTLNYMTALTSAKGITDVTVSEPMMGQAYSLVLVRVADAKDAKTVAQTMYDGIDTRKWICVMADTKTAGYIDDLAIFFMVNSDFADTVSTDSIVKAANTALGNITWIG